MKCNDLSRYTVCITAYNDDPSRGTQGTAFWVRASINKANVNLLLTCDHVLRDINGEFYPRISVRWAECVNAAPSAKIYSYLRELPVPKASLGAEPGDCDGDFRPFPDLALLSVELNEIEDPDERSMYARPPCVPLSMYANRKAVSAYGYSMINSSGDPVNLIIEGKSPVDKKNTDYVLKLRDGRITPGLSGAPLLNIRTGRVCGMIKRTLSQDAELGGYAITAKTIVRHFPALKLNWWARCFDFIGANPILILPIAFVLISGIAYSVYKWEVNPVRQIALYVSDIDQATKEDPHVMDSDQVKEHFYQKRRDELPVLLKGLEKVDGKLGLVSEIEKAFWLSHGYIALAEADHGAIFQHDRDINASNALNKARYLEQLFSEHWDDLPSGKQQFYKDNQYKGINLFDFAEAVAMLAQDEYPIQGSTFTSDDVRDVIFLLRRDASDYRMRDVLSTEALVWAKKDYEKKGRADSFDPVGVGKNSGTDN